MKTFLESSATKVLLFAIIGQFLKDLLPMVQAHAIDPWALAEGQIVLLILLLGNALRPDVNVPGLNWFGPSKSEGPKP